VMDACGGALVGFLLGALISGPTISSTIFFFLLALLVAATTRAELDASLIRRAVAKSAGALEALR
jgi:hypothetical protein